MWDINLLLTEREGRTGEYWPEVVAVQIERSEVRTKTTEGQYSPVGLELARLVSSLLYGTRAMLVLNLWAFENKKYTAYPVSMETVRLAKSRPRKNQSERSDFPCHIIKDHPTEKRIVDLISQTYFTIRFEQATSLFKGFETYLRRTCTRLFPS